MERTYAPVKARFSNSGLKGLLRLQTEPDLVGVNVRSEGHRVWAHFVSNLRGALGDKVWKPALVDVEISSSLILPLVHLPVPASII